MESQNSNFEGLTQKFKILVSEYHNRRVSSYSSQTLIVCSLPSYKEMLFMMQNFKNKIDLVFFFLERLKIDNRGEKMVSLVLMRQNLGGKVVIQSRMINIPMKKWQFFLDQSPKNIMKGYLKYLQRNRLYYWENIEEVFYFTDNGLIQKK